MEILLFSGSLRAASLNKQFVAVAKDICTTIPEVVAHVIDLKTLSLPVYDGDIEESGIPEGVQKLGAAVAKAQGLIISSPEYNGAMAGSLKNTIDWLSRLRPQPLLKKPILLLGASPGGFGAIRSLTSSTIPFATLGSYVYPQTFALAKAHEVLKEGTLVDPNQHKKLIELVTNYLAFVAKLNG